MFTETYMTQRDKTDVHGQSWGTLLSLAELHLDLLHVIMHPLRLLLVLYQLGIELSAPLHLQEAAGDGTVRNK